jgi:hypothetical protein
MPARTAARNAPIQDKLAAVVVDVCDREGARISAMGVLLSGREFFLPVAGNQQLIRAKGTDPGSS